LAYTPIQILFIRPGGFPTLGGKLIFNSQFYSQLFVYSYYLQLSISTEEIED